MVKRSTNLCFISILVLLLTWQFVQAQEPPPMPPPGGFGATQVVENDWAIIAFDLKLANDILHKVRPFFQKAWDDKDQIMEYYSDNFFMIADSMKEVSLELDKNLRTVLTEDQMNSIAKLEESMQPSFFGPPESEPEKKGDSVPYILTPKPLETPKINGAKIFGVRSGSPFIYTIPATGKRPMKFEAENLPEGLKLDPDTGHISGKIIKNGEYVVTLKAINELGKSVREFRIVCGDNICLTPAMGWSSWYVWARDVSEQHLLDTAKAMVESGLINHGWTYINIDDGWQGKRGGKFNAIQPNEKFTDMQSLCDYVHSLGLRIGIYSTPWITSYARYIGGSSNYEDGQWSSDESSMQGPPGGPNNSSLAENIWSTLAFKLKLDDANLDKAIPILQKAWDERKRLTEEADWGFQAMADGMAKLKPEIYKEIKSILTEEQFKALSELENSQEQPESNSPYGKFSFVKNDVNQWAEWGIDYFKYDWNPIDIPHSTEMGDALKACGRDIVYTLSNQASFEHASDWARIANSWRTTFDLSDNWQTISRIGFYQDKWATYAGPGHWNDPDMIMIGKVGTGRGLHPSGLTPDEQYAHFSLWCLLSAPLILGCDLTDLDDFTLNLITNDEVIDIDQDALGKQATRVMKSGDHEVWAKDLEDGSKAVGLFNLGDLAGKVTFIWSDINVNGKQIVRDLWRQKDIGTFDGNFEAEVPSHGVVLVKISPVKIK